MDMPGHLERGGWRGEGFERGVRARGKVRMTKCIGEEGGRIGERARGRAGRSTTDRVFADARLDPVLAVLCASLARKRGERMKHRLGQELQCYGLHRGLTLLTAMRAPKLSTQPRTSVTGPPSTPPVLTERERKRARGGNVGVRAAHAERPEPPVFFFLWARPRRIAPDNVAEAVVVLDGGNVHAVVLDVHVWVDEVERALGSLDLGQARLVRLEEEAVEGVGAMGVGVVGLLLKVETK